MRAIGLDDVRFVDALTTRILFGAFDRRVWVLRLNCCLNLCRCLASERLFSGAVHVMAIRSAGSGWGLSSPVGVLALLRLSRWCRSSGVVSGCCETGSSDDRPSDDTCRDQPNLLEAAESR